MTAQPIRRHLTLALVGLAVALTVGACSAGAGSGAPTAPPASNPPAATPPPSAPVQPDARAVGGPGLRRHAHHRGSRPPIATTSGSTSSTTPAASSAPGPACPAEGISVDTGRVVVDNVDDRTLRLTWSDFAMDNALALYIDESGATAILVQPGPVGTVDAIGADRQLVLTFDAPIDAGDLRISVQDGLDTPGE